MSGAQSTSPLAAPAVTQAAARPTHSAPSSQEQVSTTHQQSPATSTIVSEASSVPTPALVPLLRYPTHIELRAQYDRSGRLARAVEEFYDHDATLPCLAYGELTSLSSDCLSTARADPVYIRNPSP